MRTGTGKVEGDPPIPGAGFRVRPTGTDPEPPGEELAITGRDRNGRRGRRLRTLGAAAIALAFGGCGGNDSGPTVQEIVRDPEGHYGEEVTVESTVSRQIDHRVWEMADGRLFVIKDDPVHPLPTTGEGMRINGTVRPFEKRTIEGDLGINIEDHFFTDDFLADDVVVVAETVERLSDN